MARKAKSKRYKRKPARPGWWRSLDDRHRRRVFRAVGAALLVMSLAGAGAVGMTRLDRHVRNVVAAGGDPAVVLVDLPEQLAGLADADLHSGLDAVLTQSGWLDGSVCRKMAHQLEKSGWVAKVNHISRTSDAQFNVSCTYRTPAAMVQQEDKFFFVDAEGVRLPGSHLYDPAWQLIQGIEAPAPPGGSPWIGADLQAGLRIIDTIQREPFAHQITGVLVGNYGGRVNPGLTHIQLATDHAGGRIRWGSAPGRELEENSVAEKLGILRQNYRRTRRADANHSVIDISTLPGRFLVAE